MVHRYRVFRMFGNKLWRIILGHGERMSDRRVAYIIRGGDPWFYSSKNFIRAG
jgi:hypothetical protein